MSEMEFEGFSLKLGIPVAVFYSTILASKCQADYTPDNEDRIINIKEFVGNAVKAYAWTSGDESVQLYNTAVPWQPIQLDTEKNNFAIVAWTAVLTVAITVAVVVCLCCLCWKLYPKYSSCRRQNHRMSTVRFIPSSNQRLRFCRGMENFRRGRCNSTTFMNFAFIDSLQNETPNPQYEDRPPEYASVVSQTPSKDNLESAPCPQISEIKVETPPPAYVNVAPFSNFV